MATEKLIHKTEMTRLFDLGGDGVIIAAAGNDDIYITRDEALSLSNAILKHFGETE